MEALMASNVAPRIDDRAKVRLVYRSNRGVCDRIWYADQMSVDIANPPSTLADAKGRVFDHRGTECPSGTPVYYARRVR